MLNQLGDNWLLLRGLSRESAHWGDFLPELQAAMPESCIHVMDLPGTGQFHQLISPDNIPAITRQVREQALAQGLLKQPLTLLGLSMGGLVAWEWLLQYPGDLQGAVLINTSFASLSPFYQRLCWQRYPALAGILLQNDVGRRELAIIQLVSNRRDQDELVADKWQAIQLLHPVSYANTLRQIQAAAGYKPPQIKPQHPVLLVNSLGDRLVSPACTDAIQRRWQFPFCSHPWAGHDLTLDDGSWLIDQLQSWLVVNQD